MRGVHVAERLAIAAGSVADRRAQRILPLGVIAVVLAAVVGLMAVYVSVRELTEPGSILERNADPVQRLSQVSPAAGDAAKLMSIDDMRRLVNAE